MPWHPIPPPNAPLTPLPLTPWPCSSPPRRRRLQTDINDKPPDPEAAPAAPRLKPRPKPWEQRSAAAPPAASTTADSASSSSSLASLLQVAAPPPPPGSHDGGAQGAVGAAAVAPSPTAPSPSAMHSPPKQAASIYEAGKCVLYVESGLLGNPLVAPVKLKLFTIMPIYSKNLPISRSHALTLPAVGPAPESPHVIAGRLSPAGNGGGVFGSVLSTPIINPPQSAILGMHATNMRPWVVNGQDVPR